jgi:hypothetical protein
VKSRPRVTLQSRRRSETEWQEESEETTLVDGVEVLPVLQRTTSAALD